MIRWMLIALSIFNMMPSILIADVEDPQPETEALLREERTSAYSERRAPCNGAMRIALTATFLGAAIYNCIPTPENAQGWAAVGGQILLASVPALFIPFGRALPWRRHLAQVRKEYRAFLKAMFCCKLPEAH